MSSFVIKKDALLPVLEATLTDEYGDPIDLTGASGVEFRMKRVGETTYTVESAGSITDAANGVVTYIWASGDTDTDGDYEGEWVVTISGKEQVFPGAGYFNVQVAADDSSDLPDLVFCTPAQARGIVGQVDLDMLALAQTIISMRTGVQPTTAGVDEDDTHYDGLDDQDQIGLRQATAFQAKWLTGQPDFLTRIPVTQESADGLARTYLTSSMALAPMAEWALSNTRFAVAVEGTVLTPRAGHTDGVELIPYGNVFPDERGWRPW